MSQKKPRILIVDDDPEILRILEHLLRRFDYEPYTALNGLDGLKRVDELRPDLLIVDMMMPMMTGPQLIQALRTNPAYARLPILVLSSLSRMDDKNEAFRAGADDYMTKPTRPTDFLARVQTMLTRTYTSLQPTAQVIAVIDGSELPSTVALNLSVMLALHDHKVVLAELYSGRSIVRHYTEIPAGFNLNRLLDVDRSIPSQLTLEHYLLRHASGLAMLPATSEQFPLTANQAQKIVNVLEKGQDYVVVDLSKASESVRQMVVEMADHILLVTEPELTAVQGLAQQLEQLAEWGVNHKAMIMTAACQIIGKGFSRIEVEQEIEANLSRPEHQRNGWSSYPVVATVPAAPELYDRAAQLSLPLVMYDPASLPARAYAELALWLAQQEPAGAITPKKVMVPAG